MNLAKGMIFEDRYEILGQLGSGGMGSVYRAKQVDANRLVAIKIMHQSQVEDEEMRKRFLREAKALSLLEHQNIVVIYSFGISNEQFPYYVMECLEGRSLASVIGEEAHIKPERAIKIVSQIASALQYSHDKGIYHRDLKPANIILVNKPEEDFVKVVDFGLAK